MNSEEERLRALLAGTLTLDPPSPRLDLLAARRAGRRRLRLRRAGTAGATAGVLGVAAAVVLSTGALRLPGVAGHGTLPAAAPGKLVASPLVRAPRQFDLLVPYASFGTLPKGFSTSNQHQGGDATSVSLTAATASASASLNLSVHAAGACVITHVRISPTAGRRPAAPSGCVLGPELSRAPAVGGRPAYWVHGGLIWEYAPRAWASLTGDFGFFFPKGVPSWRGQPPTPGQKRVSVARLRDPGAGAPGRELLQTASGVRYGNTTPILFPFTLTALPAGWQASGVAYMVSGGLLADNGITVNPAGHPSRAVSIITIPVSAGARWCGKFIPGQSQDVVIGSAPAVLRIIDNPPKLYEDLCIGDLHAMSFDLTEETLRPLTHIAAGLRSLGPDPRRWTTNPLP